MQRDASVGAATLGPQPFAVEQMRARELRTEARASQTIDGFPKVGFGGVAFTEKRARASLDP
jgi:hypothetical protein